MTILNKKTLCGLILTFTLLGISICLELLGNQILDPSLTFSDVWSWPFFTGSLRTASAAFMMGVLFVVIALIPVSIRFWAKTNFIQIWAAGAILFLITMALLIFWAP